MRKLLILTLSTVLAATTATGVQAKGLKWMAGPPGLPAGSTFAVVSGDPGKAGMFTIQARLPANYVIPPHKHPTDEKVGVVSGGPFTYGMGDKIDRSASAAIDKGYHVTMGAAMNHWVLDRRQADDDLRDGDGSVRDHLRQPQGRPADEIGFAQRAATKRAADAALVGSWFEFRRE